MLIFVKSFMITSQSPLPKSMNKLVMIFNAIFSNCGLTSFGLMDSISLITNDKNSCD